MVSYGALFAQSHRKESIMKLKRLLLATLAGSAAIVSAPVFADHGWHEGHGWRGEHRYWHHYRPYYYEPPRVIYGPRVVYPAPAYYPPAPVYYPAPVYSAPFEPSVSIRFRLPL